MKKACKHCRILVEGDKCPICNEKDFTESWKGRIVIIDPEKSEIAKNLKFEKKGVYAIKTR